MEQAKIKMKLPGEYIDPELEKLRNSNNQHEERLNIHSEQISKLQLELQKLRDENQRRKSMEF